MRTSTAPPSGAAHPTRQRGACHPNILRLIGTVGPPSSVHLYDQASRPAGPPPTFGSTRPLAPSIFNTLPPPTGFEFGITAYRAKERALGLNNLSANLDEATLRATILAAGRGKDVASVNQELARIKVDIADKYQTISEAIDAKDPMALKHERLRDTKKRRVAKQTANLGTQAMRYTPNGPAANASKTLTPPAIPNPVAGPSDAAAAPSPLEHTASPMRHRPPTSSAVGLAVEGQPQVSGQQQPAHLDQLDKFDTLCASITPAIRRSTVTPPGVGYARPGEVPTADNRCPVCQVVFKNRTWKDHIHTCAKLAMARQLKDGYMNLVKGQRCPCSQCGEGPWDQPSELDKHLYDYHAGKASRTPQICSITNEVGEPCGAYITSRPDYTVHLETHHGYLPNSVLNHSLASRVYYCETCEEWIVGIKAWLAHCVWHIDNDLAVLATDITCCQTQFFGRHVPFNHFKTARCPFCLFDPEASAINRWATFASSKAATRHINTAHLLPHAAGAVISCPWAICGKQGSPTEVAQHLIDTHGLHLVLGEDNATIKDDLSTLHSRPTKQKRPIEACTEGVQPAPNRKGRPRKSDSSTPSSSCPSTVPATAPAAATTSSATKRKVDIDDSGDATGPAPKRPRLGEGSTSFAPTSALTSASAATPTTTKPNRKRIRVPRTPVVATCTSTKFDDLVISKFDVAGLQASCRAQGISVHNKGVRLTVPQMMRRLGVRKPHSTRSQLEALKEMARGAKVDDHGHNYKLIQRLNLAPKDVPMYQDLGDNTDDDE